MACMENAAHMLMKLELANLWMIRKTRMGMMGVVYMQRVQADAMAACWRRAAVLDLRLLLNRVALA